MKIIVQSFSDIITNSSSEVFVSESSEELINALNELGIKYDCFETEEQLRSALESDWYDFNELVPLNIYRDIYYYIDELRKYRTDDDGNTFRYRMTDDILSEPEVFYNVKK